LKLLDEETGRLSKDKILNGEVAFKLYDTYGFPLDLTQDILRGQGGSVDTPGFEAAMDRQRTAARKAWVGSGEAATDQIWFDVREKVGASDFLGYATEVAEGQILALIKDGKQVRNAKVGDEVAIVANQTPFYGESGGQMGDAGVFIGAKGIEIAIADTQKKLGDLHVHYGRVTAGELALGDAVEMRVDGERRSRLRANHSATHLLHEALRRRFGPHVSQKGSLVAPDRLRFDYSHPVPPTPEDIALVAAEVNRRVRANAEVITRVMTPDEAVKNGALALFGEKYGEEVRVVSMGGDEAGRSFSTELCGGTHVRRTGDIGLFMIVGEAAVAAGVRRIEALTGPGAEAYVAEQERLIGEAAATLRVQPGELPQRVASLVEERKRLERELMEARKRLATGGSAEESGVKDVGGIKLATRLLDGVPAKELKGMADVLKQQIGSGVVALVARSDDRASLVVGVTADLTQRFNAVDLAQLGSRALGGQGGGGRPDMAQSGGPDSSCAQAALSAIEQAIRAAARAA
jgi:alanyl-tRNA synthetase